jgi:hypothetical protein
MRQMQLRRKTPYSARCGSSPINCASEPDLSNQIRYLNDQVE